MDGARPGHVFMLAKVACLEGKGLEAVQGHKRVGQDWDSKEKHMRSPQSILQLCFI